MSLYTFDDKDILNSSVRLSGSLVFTTTTTKNDIYRDRTTISDTNESPIGSIRWKERALELLGEVRGTDLIKAKPHSLIDWRWERMWQWDPSRPRYAVKFGVNQWIATELSTGAVHASMTPYIPRLFKNSTDASVTFSEGLDDSNKWFLLLVLLRMETRRIESNRRLRAKTQPHSNTIVMADGMQSSTTFFGFQ